MSRSFGFSVYRALSRQWDPEPDANTIPPRPKGELVWIHVSDPSRFGVLGDLIDRLKAQRLELKILVTFEQNAATAPEVTLPENGADLVLGLQPGHPTQAKHFATHWRPDACLWVGGSFQSGLISAVSEIGASMILADIGETDLQSSRRKWFAVRARNVVDMFDTILVRDAATARAIRRFGVDHRKVAVSGALRIGVMPPFCADENLNDLIEELAARPVWLAVAVRRDEIEPILQAHRKTMRLAHRLLLILTLADPEDAEELKSQLERFSLRFVDRDSGAPVEDTVQVVFSAYGDEMGLWYRASPLALLASSLAPGAEGVDPMPAAALGSALLKGPYISSYQESFSRLARAGAVETVRDAETLTAALIRLIAPDRAAAMALAGWEVATEGAELTDRLLDVINDGLDQRKARNARA